MSNSAPYLDDVTEDLVRATLISLADLEHAPTQPADPPTEPSEVRLSEPPPATLAEMLSAMETRLANMVDAVGAKVDGLYEVVGDVANEVLGMHQELLRRPCLAPPPIPEPLCTVHPHPKRDNGPGE